MGWSRSFAGVVLTAVAGCVGEEAPRDWVNVVVILTDDQGTLDMGAYGAADVDTPHMDALAARGVRFTQFYAASSICSPSRAALLTGKYPHRAGVPGNVPPTGRGLPPEQVTIAEMLGDAGYATGLVGKWHLGSTPEDSPLTQGFDRFYGHRQGCIDNYSHFFFWNGPNKHDLWRGDEEIWEDGVHFGELMEREARRFVREHRDEPFFLFLPFNTPHYPLQGLPHWRERYADLEHPRSDYAALLSTLDEQVGAILGELDAQGLTENTLVIFQSDHGHSTEVRSFSSGGYAGDLRGAKFSLFEGGIRVPAIASLPGVLPEGVTRDQVAHAADWLPTIAGLTGAQAPSDLDGRDLGAVLLHGADSPHDALHWVVGDQWAVREGRWKLLANPRDTDRTKLKEENAIFLVDLDADATESTNLAGEYAEEVERLTALHDAWWEVVSPPPPDEPAEDAAE